jgi:hypothetical protein
MWRSLLISVGLFVSLSGLTGCGSSARYVSATPDGGIIAIPANTDDWPSHYRRDANQLMASKCPQGYVIEHEEEVSVGTVTTHQTKADPDPFKGIIMGQTVDATEVRDQKEYHITFHAKQPDMGMIPVSPRAAALPSSQGLPTSPIPVGN